MRVLVLALFCALCSFVRPAIGAPAGLQPAEANEVLAGQVADLRQALAGLKLIVDRQSREIAELRGMRMIPPPSPEQVTVPAPVPPAQGRWNPDIGVVADTVLKLDSPKADAEGSDRVSVREFELVLGSPVDSYSRLDSTVSFSDFETPSLEEAYLTRFDLPLDLTARIGRFKPRIGKAVGVHRDSLDTVDEPLLIQRYFGLEGYNKTGADVLKHLDLPTGWAHQLSLGVLEGGNGDGGTLFGSARRTPTFYSHLKNYVDWSEDTGLEIGMSHLAGSRDTDSSFEVNAIGLDATWIRRLGDRRHVKWQGESFYVNRRESFVETEGSNGEILFNDRDDGRHLWGSYLLADFRLGPLWGTGFRFDRVQRVDDAIANPESADLGYTGYLTFYQSEFARWRFQFSRFDLATGQDDNQVMVQGLFAIGEHKHKIQ